MKNILSLGAGVQSSTLALMASLGEVAPKPDFAIFADTQAEPESVYQWLDWLEGQLTFPLIRVTTGNLTESILRVRTSKKTNLKYLKQEIPAYILNPNGTKGQMWRQCTSRFKVDPIQKYCKQFKKEGIVMWMGISTDEAQRMKDSRKFWIEHRYPLIEMGISREDCLTWMADNNYPKPPRSACVYCPYHSDKEWTRLKNEEPAEFARAIKFEKDLQAAFIATERLEGKPFLHNSRKNLDTITFTHEDQIDLFGNECEGMCGV